MITALVIIALIASFYLLGKAADTVIINVRSLGEKLGIQMFFLGIVLGFLTSLPELFLGINSVINGIPEVSLGNLLGGIIVLFGFVAGVSIFYNRKIKSNNRTMDFVLVFVYMLFPLFLGFDGEIGFIDAFILISVYIFLLYIFYIKQKKQNHIRSCIGDKENDVLKKILYILIGMVLIAVMSGLIMKLFVYLLDGLHVSLFIIGLVMFSLGTNLPELVIVMHSFRNKVGELSLSNTIGSAISNVVIIGILALFRPFKVQVDASYLALIFFTILIFISFLYFYRTDGALTRKEGLILILIYLLFLIVQIGFLLVS